MRMTCILTALQKLVNSILINIWDFLNCIHLWQSCLNFLLSRRLFLGLSLLFHKLLMSNHMVLYLFKDVVIVIDSIYTAPSLDSERLTTNAWPTSWWYIMGFVSLILFINCHHNSLVIWETLVTHRMSLINSHVLMLLRCVLIHHIKHVGLCQSLPRWIFFMRLFLLNLFKVSIIEVLITPSELKITHHWQRIPCKTHCVLLLARRIFGGVV
jgi:hypothetical protein